MAEQRERDDVKGLSDDPTGRSDVGGPEIPGGGTGGGTGTTGNADDAGGMGAELDEAPGARGDGGDQDPAEDDAEAGPGGRRG